MSSKEAIEHRYGVKIYKLGESELTVRCADVSVDDILSNSSIREAKERAHLALKNFRQLEGFGRAIAAPQVGCLIRMIAMNLGGKEITLFNPVITSRSEEKITMWDDCLSFPDLMVCVERSKQISIEFLDESGSKVEWADCTVDISELLQHEIDHLDGVLAVSRAVKPPTSGVVREGDQKAFSCEAVVSRADWLADRQLYNQLVSFHY